MSELLIGAAGVIVLAAIFLLVGRLQQSRPGDGGGGAACGGCSLASVCDRRIAGEPAGGEERQECYVGEEPGTKR